MKMKKYAGICLPRLAMKVVLILLILNLLCLFGSFLPIGKLSLYNLILPGRPRLPFGENPQVSYNLTINNLDAMVYSHEISKITSNTETYRILLLGDSSIWGFLQRPEETLTSILDKKEMECNEQPVEVYNFGYPSLSLLKDLFLLNKAIDFNPDLILWFVTLESMNQTEQLSTPLVANNPDELNRIINTYQLSFPTAEVSLFDRSLINQRRNYADLVRLQLYGVMWAATGIDQEYPESYTPAQRNFELDSAYKNYAGQTIEEDDLALDVIQRATENIDQAQIILINEPILISSGINSDIRYNYYYPRWAYDQYREILKRFAKEHNIKYYDLWDLVPEANFTNSAIHLDSEGTLLLADEVERIIWEHCLP